MRSIGGSKREGVSPIELPKAHQETWVSIYLCRTRRPQAPGDTKRRQSRIGGCLACRGPLSSPAKSHILVDTHGHPPHAESHPFGLAISARLSGDFPPSHEKPQSSVSLCVCLVDRSHHFYDKNRQKKACCQFKKGKEQNNSSMKIM